MKRRTPKQIIEERRHKRQVAAVKTGVYFAIVAGVMAQSAIQRFDPRELVVDLELTGWSYGKMVVALVIAWAIYTKLDREGELRGKAKNWKRTLTLGFTSGFTLMGIVGIGE